MDPRPFTLRQLVWMHEAKQKAEWARVGSAVWWMVRSMTGESVELNDIVPARYMPRIQRDSDIQRAPEQLERESARAWSVLDRFFDQWRS